MRIFTQTFDWIPPRTVLANLPVGKGTALLESVKPACRQAGNGRYSILVTEPFKIVRALKQLETELAKLPPVTCSLPFCGGAVGLLNYELAHEFEKFPQITDETLPRLPADRHGVWFGLYDHGLIFDNEKKVLTAFAWRKTDIRCWSEVLLRSKKPPRLASPTKGEEHKVSSNFPRPQYLSAVKKIKRLIQSGYTFQVNLSQKFTLKVSSLDPIQTYDHLARVNPAPFAGYLDAGSFQIISSSPELLFQANGKEIETRPIAGTRPRGQTPTQDQRLEQELRKSSKENAEHIMLVDLERNDMGQICEFGSVRVMNLARVEKYARVQHLVSTITGRLRPKTSLRDILRALFPGGTITGCPKVETMKIISQLEGSARGPYTGSLGYISANGNTQFNILIRTLVHQDNELTWQVGGGIVADSDPAAEYDETLAKASALFEAVLGKQENTSLSRIRPFSPSP